MRAPLWLRLVASYVAVVATGLGAAYLTVRLLAPRLFDDSMARGMGMGMGLGTGPAIRNAFRAAVDNSLLVAVAVSVVVAAGVALLVSRRLVRPLDEVRAATRRVAAGDYRVRIPTPAVPEFAALAADVTSLADALARTETRRARLLGDVAHEMRTPLTTLDGYVEGIVDGIFTADEETLDALGGELRRLHRLADDLASLSRAEEGRLDLLLAPCDLAATARSCAMRLAPQFADAGVTLIVVPAAEVGVLADAHRIEQVLTNLLGNALRATPPGGRVTVAAQLRGREASVAVSDTGVGLVADDLERVFERFYRVPPAGGRGAGTGTGVGLTIARSIARAHGGDLRAESPGIGGGAVFTLRLPARR